MLIVSMFIKVNARININIVSEQSSSHLLGIRVRVSRGIATTVSVGGNMFIGFTYTYTYTYITEAFPLLE